MPRARATAVAHADLPQRLVTQLHRAPRCANDARFRPGRAQRAPSVVDASPVNLKFQPDLLIATLEFQI
jgi:hypothetical protein